MRILLAVSFGFLSLSIAAAQTDGGSDKKKGDSPHSTGRTVVPKEQGPNQPSVLTVPVVVRALPAGQM